MRIAIYSRKSKFTGKGDSVENQVEMCRAYIQTHIPDSENAEIIVYEDEGYSAKNLDRPRFKQMITDNGKQKFDYIVVYRLDRISRNVGDFATLIEQLNTQKVGFICIKEQFDTSTPMGRAMMYIASVFAQLERETIAERVRDNVHLLARDGRWLGGTAPTGFKPIKVDNIEFDGKTRSCWRLQVNPDEIKLVKTIYEKFLETRSLAQVERYLLVNDIYSKNGKKFTLFTIKLILTNPVYCTADETSYQYFADRDCDLCCQPDELNGKSGFIAFNRTDSSDKRSKKPMSEWLIAVGTHEGVISSADWLKVQAALEGNKSFSERKVHNSDCLLSGVVRCKCGSFMRPKYTRVGASGNRTFVYMCETKEKTRRKKCHNSNVNGNTLDELVCTELLNYNTINANIKGQLEALRDEIKSMGDTYGENMERLQKSIDGKNAEIATLIDKLAKRPDEATEVYIDKRIPELDAQIKELQAEHDKLALASQVKTDLQAELGSLKDIMKNFKKELRKLSVAEKRDYIKKCVSKVVWNGEQVDIFLVGKYI
jgi:site-specific DNA recombinase